MRITIENPRRKLTSIFIVWTLCAFATQALPSNSAFHDRLARFFSPYLSLTGTWIGSTSFFSPSPPKDVMQVEGRVFLPDGTVRNWVTPEVPSLSLVDKFIYARGIKYFDNLYRDTNSAAWPFFARYLLLRAGQEGMVGARVELIRRWRTTPPPSAGWWALQPWGVETGYPHEYTFYRSPR